MLNLCPGESPRANFDSFANAMITVFILLVGDDWNSYMFDYTRTTSKASILYFTSLTVIGNLILLNLFLAILLKQFEQTHEDQSE
jgi:voltage-dependent calcium channel L type alpha-1D